MGKVDCPHFFTDGSGSDLIEHTVEAGVAGIPLTQYILRAWPLASARAVKDAAKARDIRVNGTKAGADTPVSGGDVLKIYLNDRQLGLYPVEIAYADENLIAAVKPAGLPVDTDRSEIGADTLLNRVRAEYPEAQLAHRLDTGTGGIVMLSRNARTHEAMLRAFKEHLLEKRYIAVVRGEPRETVATLNAHLTKNASGSTVSVSRAAKPGSKPITTRYAVLSRNMAFSVVEAEPVTGRTHQLRAHFAFEGNPILGDDKYGDRDFNRKFKKNMPVLWCKSICFTGAPGLERYNGRTFTAKPQGFEDFL